jgi:hypothetical protein
MSSGKNLISEALMRIMECKVPDDPHGRTYADLIVEATVARAIKGDLAAIKEITDRVEGPLPRSRAVVMPNKRCTAPPMTVVWPEGSRFKDMS